jgi:hypothetical protein
MKAFSKPITWLLTSFNVGVYQLSDTIDSLMQQLFEVGLQNHAESIIFLSQRIAYQQTLIVGLDVLKCLFMLISLVFFFITNKAVICSSFRWFQTKINQFYSFFKQLFKTKS